MKVLLFLGASQICLMCLYLPHVSLFASCLSICLMSLYLPHVSLFASCVSVASTSLKYRLFYRILLQKRPIFFDVYDITHSYV